MKIKFWNLVNFRKNRIPFAENQSFLDILSVFFFASLWCPCSIIGILLGSDLYLCISVMAPFYYRYSSRVKPVPLGSTLYLCTSVVPPPPAEEERGVYESISWMCGAPIRWPVFSCGRTSIYVSLWCPPPPCQNENSKCLREYYLDVWCPQSKELVRGPPPELVQHFRL